MARRGAAPQALLQVDLLGRIEVRTAAGARVSFAGRHAPALFALLVLVRRPRSREAIAADLWPESDAASAGSLRQALWLVRHGLSDAGLPPDSVLDVSTEAIAVRADANIALDIVAFEACLDDPARQADDRRRESRSRTAAVEASKAVRSAGVSSISNTRSIPSRRARPARRRTARRRRTRR